MNNKVREAWSYELATLKDLENDQYSGWQLHLSEYKPNVPEGAIRNLKHLVEEKEWQSIETAPKDGSSVLIFYNAIMGPIVREAYFDGGMWQTINVRVDKPTNWMPLPTPPKGE